jgi:hypothetical protein
MIIGFSRGDAIRNEMVDPKGIPELIKPNVIGMVEQAQKGVKDPIRAPKKFPFNPFPDR